MRRQFLQSEWPRQTCGHRRGYPLARRYFPFAMQQGGSIFLGGHFPQYDLHEEQPQGCQPNQLLFQEDFDNHSGVYLTFGGPEKLVFRHRLDGSSRKNNKYLHNAFTYPSASLCTKTVK